MIEINKLKKQYGDFSLDVSMEVREGCVTGLIGKNGAGKSSTFKAILGLIRPDGGSVRILGKDALSMKEADKQLIGVAMADSSFSSYLTVKDIVLILRKLYKDFEEKKFLEQCKEFELPLNKRIQTFSTGMKAKLRVLTAVSHRASLLILDEPTSGLDVMARKEILDLLRRYMEVEGRAILISSHISSDLEGLCDDLYLIDRGKILLHEDTDEILDNYGILKVEEKELEKLDKQYLLRVQRENFGYVCLTNEKRFYVENYPKIVVEKGNIDDVMALMIGGEKL